MRLLRALLIIRQIPEADTDVGDQIVDQMDRRGQHGIVTRYGERVMELHIIFVFAWVLFQMLDRCCHRRNVLVRRTLAGKLDDTDLYDLSELIECPARVHLVRAFNPGTDFLNKVRIAQQDLPVSAALDRPKKLQDSKALSQRAAAHAEAFGKLALTGKLLPHMNVSCLNCSDE